MHCLALDNGEGIWQVVLDPHSAGGPYNLNVTAQGSRLELKDIFFGDVLVMFWRRVTWNFVCQRYTL